jgi:hypothetical protein
MTRLLVAAAVFPLLLSGCKNAVGPSAMRGARKPYNESLRTTTDEQILLNLVRLRYRDTPSFLEVASISTGYAFNRSLGSSLSVKRGVADDAFGGTTGLAFNESPTITYTPMQGDRFAKQMLSPLPVESLSLLSQSGWNFDRILRVVAQRINGIPNAPSASGPTPAAAPSYEKFIRAAQDLRELQKTGEVYMESEMVGENAAQVRLKFHPAGTNAPALQSFHELLELSPEDNEFDVFTGMRPSTPKSIVINTRSMISIMYFLSQSVEVPAEDMDAGYVTRTLTESGQEFDWQQVLGGLLRIQFASSRPNSRCTAVEYRGTWFYIDDADLESKSTFSMLSMLFALQAGDVRSIAPVLTLPVSR